MKKILAPDKNYPASFLTYLTILVLIMVIAGIIACSKSKNQSYNIVKVRGEAFVLNHSKSCSYTISSDSAISSAMLMEDGDVIGTNHFFYDYYQESKTKQYLIQNNDSLLYINDKRSSIKISDQYEVIHILKQMSDAEIKELRSLVFGDSIPDKYLPYIEKIASKNKTIGLHFEKTNEPAPSIIKKFAPTWIILEEFSNQDLNVLRKLKNTRALWINESDSLIIEPLPKMPQLKQLILSETPVSEGIIGDFLINNQQIERVVLGYENMPSLSMLKPLKKLKSLTFITDSIDLNLENLNYKQLEVLAVNSEKVENFDSIHHLPSLKWLTLPGSITQDEFNSIIHKHENLEVLEMLECKNIHSLEALTNLPKLKGLVIIDTICDKETLKSLTQLKYLSIPEIDYQDSTYLSTLHESIPAMVVPNEGFCLGSGWLLLLFPLILMFVIIRKRR